MDIKNKNHKLFCLDGLRGWAAFAVFAHHFSLAFCPQLLGMNTHNESYLNIKETPLFIFINGPAAVSLFFVLSGFVLSVSLWQNIDGIIHSIIKRYPRLVLLPLISVLVSFTLYKFNLFQYKEASRISESNWLMQFGYSPNGGNITENFIDSFLQGTYYTFFRGDHSLNISLWTMHIEFVGSILTFAFVAVCSKIKTSTTIFFSLILSVLFCYQDNYFYIAFLLGAIISRLYLNNSQKKNGILSHFLLFVSLISLGFFDPGVGFYSFISKLNLNQAIFRIFLHIAASAILINYCLRSTRLKVFLSNKTSTFMGKISFPFYVIHIPIMMSLSSTIFILSYKIGYKTSLIITLFATITFSFLVAHLLASIDSHWCTVINKVTKKITPTL
ncbi:TPA: acyltransferase [Escherichia coli]|uniref:acyltransferase family protein n=1 Tax=Escherichia coli TaxID=562 RepID=UPI00110690B8|nr:acyltransferase [Escherichia coli]HAO0723592.1 acyltransferase [Escherichia coli]HAO1233985.1 acyltransferase [Escherichia coli]HBN0540886.1 acyltransferase [Escherichia coli]